MAFFFLWFFIFSFLFYFMGNMLLLSLGVEPGGCFPDYCLYSVVFLLTSHLFSYMNLLPYVCVPGGTALLPHESRQHSIDSNILD